MTDLGWIEIANWDKFQHYKERNPPWIKNHTDLLHREEYLSLTGEQRSILHGLWLEYASSSRRLRADTTSLSRRLGLRVTRPQLESLNHAGFITFSASAPLAPHARARTRSREAETETEEQEHLGSTGYKSSYGERTLDQAGDFADTPASDTNGHRTGGENLISPERLQNLYQTREIP